MSYTKTLFHQKLATEKREVLSLVFKLNFSYEHYNRTCSNNENIRSIIIRVFPFQYGGTIDLRILITARNGSCGKVMFSVVSVCPWGWVCLVPGPFWGMGMSRGRGWVCISYWHLVAATTCTVGKRAICILLECFIFVLGNILTNVWTFTD